MESLAQERVMLHKLTHRQDLKTNRMTGDIAPRGRCGTSSTRLRGKAPPKARLELPAAHGRVALIPKAGRLDLIAEFLRPRHHAFKQNLPR